MSYFLAVLPRSACLLVLLYPAALSILFNVCLFRRDWIWIRSELHLSISQRCNPSRLVTSGLALTAVGCMSMALYSNIYCHIHPWIRHEKFHMHPKYVAESKTFTTTNDLNQGTCLIFSYKSEPHWKEMHARVFFDACAFANNINGISVRLTGKCWLLTYLFSVYMGFSFEILEPWKYFIKCSGHIIA